MAIETSYSQARAELASLLDRVTQDRETVIIKSKSRPPVAMIDAEELSSLEETAYLLRSPANAERLLAALERSRNGQGDRMSMEELRQRMGL
ncbi:type II toxin-antitoxin system prevent-host-death family antitoxin [Acidithiobacillus sp. AMEEHan]|uniref:type II toxin-antitoxin system Phd/YefM family antitoxin n=1 Tax=Acidithiobacillus sp. AMEEHan TaxID=2994951 RepID=UPI0027E5AC2D|nr:type II toxin-antitoxin system prevent-host-death family antitoxin [Acidithiobacillus sp. AMEEHan]